MPIQLHRFARLRFWLICWLLMLDSPSVLAETYQAHDESLQTFFTALSLPLGQPVVVSAEAARKRISGVFNLDAAQQVFEETALQQGLIWYGDGQAFYLYDASEAKSSVVALRHISVDMLRGFMRRSGLDAARHPLREGGARMFYVSGPPKYVDQVMQLAQLMDRQRAELRVGREKIGVVQVLNSHVGDRQYDMGDKTLTVPGMASTIETLLATGLLAGEKTSVLAYPDTNSLLIKGRPEHVSFIENLVAELDVPKRAVEVSLWLVDVDRAELKKITGDTGNPALAPAATRVLEPLEDSALMTRIAALERRRRAKVSALPVILAQENVPAVFHDHQTFYVPRPGDDSEQWQPVVYGTQVSVLPRFAEANEIEMQISIEDGRQAGTTRQRDKRTAAVGQVGINTVVRVAPGRRLLVGEFQRAADGPLSGRYQGAMANSVRLFVIEARAVGNGHLADAVPGQPPPLTRSQHERVKRSFIRAPAS